MMTTYEAYEQLRFVYFETRGFSFSSNVYS
jgi:hypothetical protein